MVVTETLIRRVVIQCHPEDADRMNAAYRGFKLTDIKTDSLGVTMTLERKEEENDGR